jgi:hypothetical protein
MDETTITGRLPGLDIEIARRQAPSGAEIVSVSLTAVPDLASALARLAPMFPALLMSPHASGNSTAPAGLMPMAAWTFWLQTMAQIPPWSIWFAFNPWLRALIPDQTPVDERPDSSHVR